MVCSGVPGLVSAGGRPEHLSIAGVADDQPLFGVEHAQPMRHVVERDVQLNDDALKLGLAVQQFDRVNS